jgi:hypothetical protein
MDDVDEFIRRRRNSKNCHIERMVYDVMFKYHMKVTTQDMAHKTIKIRVEREMFETCWGPTMVDVKVVHKDHCPVTLTIIYIAPTKTIIETYEKTLLDAVNGVYDTEVKCSRSVHDGESNVAIEEKKKQSFESGERPWSGQVFSYKEPKDKWKIRHG